MKTIILQDKLKRGISLVEKAVLRSSTFPILNNILVKGEKNFLSLSATNLEIAITWWALAKIEIEGATSIPAQVFSNLISSLPNQPVTLEVKNNLLVVNCQNYQTSIKGQLAEEFPVIPKITEAEIASLGAKPFCFSLSQVADFALPSTTKPEISGIYFSFKNDFVKMVATDSFRLGEKQHFVDLSNLSKEYSFILPQKTAKEVINIFSEDEGELKIYFSPNQILFEKMLTETNHPQVHLISRLIEGEFPDYEAVVPKKYETQIILQKNEFLNQIRSASLFSGKINAVKLKIIPSKNQVEIFSQTPDLGSYYSFLPAKIKGKEIEISFNHRFLVDGLLNIKTPEVIFELNKEAGPGVLKPVGETGYLYVVMPIKAD